VEWASTGYENAGGWRITTRCGRKTCCAVLDEREVARHGAERLRAQGGDGAQNSVIQG
jgi:hypothetical protein